jgi:hypothetical protein
VSDLDLLKKAGETNALSRWAHGEIERLREELAALKAQPAQEPVDNLRGFSVWLCREDWGHVIDGLILERERSLQRKASNPESNSNHIADRCADIIGVLNQSANITVKPAQEPVAFLVEGMHEGKVIAHGLHHKVEDAKKMASAFAAHYPEVKTTALVRYTAPQPSADVEKALIKMIDALANIRLLAARHRKEEWSKTILRFCAEGGAVGSPLRDAQPSAAIDAAMSKGEK